MPLVRCKFFSDFNLWRTAIFLFIFIFYTSSACASITNGDFQTGGFQGWYTLGNTMAINETDGDYYASLMKTEAQYPYFSQNFSVGSAQVLNYTIWGGNTAGDFWVYIDLDGSTEYTCNHRNTLDRETFTVNVSEYSTGMFYFWYYGTSMFKNIDNIELTGYTPPVCTISFNPDVSISNQSQQYFDYSINETYGDYVYFVISVWEPLTYDLRGYENMLNDVTDGTNVSVLYPFASYNSSYQLELYATPSYPAYHEDGILLATSDIITINSSYVPSPSPIELPDLPELPLINQSYPALNQSGVLNGSINNTWLGGYYSSVDNISNSFFSPFDSFVSFVIYPVDSFNDSLVIVNQSITDQFVILNSYKSLYTLIVTPLFLCLPSKLIALFTYNLFCYLILLIFRG